MESKLRDEISNAIQYRQKLDLTKISFITVFFGLGGIKMDGQLLLKEIYYLIPFIAVFFDMLIMGQNFSIRRIGVFLKNNSRDNFERTYENEISMMRDNFFKYGSMGITILSIPIALTIILYLKDFKWDATEIIWLASTVVFIFGIHVVGNRKIKALNKFNYKIIKATVVAVVSSSDDPSLICLTKRAISPYKGAWCLPGGHIDANEVALDAINREVLEETGIKCNCKFIKYFDEIIPDINHHNVTLVFNGKASDKSDNISKMNKKTPNEEVSEVKWFSAENALKLDLAFQHKKIIEDYLNG